MARQDPRLEAAEDELIDCWRMLHCVPDRDRGFLTSGSRSALPDPIRDRITDYPDAAAPRRTLTTREVARVNAMFDGPRCIIVRAVAARDMRLVETVIRIRASQPSSGFGWDDVSNALRGHLATGARRSDGLLILRPASEATLRRRYDASLARIAAVMAERVVNRVVVGEREDV